MLTSAAGPWSSWRASVSRARPSYLLPLAPALLLALVAIPFRYESTLAEPDLVRVMAALVYGASTGLNEAAGMHYGLSFSFGYYKLLYSLAPSAWLRDPDAAAALINGVGVVSGVLCAWLCTLYLQKLFGLTAAVAAAMMFFLSPMMLPVALSGHPVMSAAACLFAGGWLLAHGEERDRLLLPYYAGAFLLLVCGLTLRADIVLAFPFLWLAAPRGAQRQGPWWRTYAWKGLILAAAFLAFLVLQRPYVEASGGAVARLSTFLETYMSVSRIGRGIVVLALAAGVATGIAAAFALVRTSWRNSEFYLPLALTAPTLALWLANPQPARHFFFAVLAFCIFAALLLARWRRSMAPVVVCSLAIVLGNQFVAELLRPIIVSHYAWSYQSVTPRRATQQVPLGVFPLDQRANQMQAGIERKEAVQLARLAPQRLIVMADAQHYLIAHLIAADPRLTWHESVRDGMLVDELRSPNRSIALVEKYGAWPRDLTGAILGYRPWDGWSVYVQPSTVSRYDKAVVPRERRFELGATGSDR